MREIERRRRRGLTILLVTHYLEQAERLCNRIAWLEAGRLRRLGTVIDVVAAYYEDLLERRYPRSQGLWDRQAIAAGVPGRYGSGKAVIRRLRTLDADGAMRTHFRRGESMRLEVEYEARPETEAVDCALPMAASDGLMVAYLRSVDQGPPSRPVDGKGRISLTFDTLPLLPGRYELSLALSAPDNPWDHYDVLYKIFFISIQPEADWDAIAPLDMPPKLDGDR
jgi:hypothetical protein